MERGTSRSSSSLPPGWVAIMDPATGREYYANPDTRETRWDPPPPQFFPPPSSQHHSSSLHHASPYPGRGGISNEDRSEAASHYSSQHRGFGGNSSSSALNQQSRGTRKHPTLPRDGNNKDNQEHFPPVILAAQTMCDKISAASSAGDEKNKMWIKSSDLELTSLTAGQIADLCHIQQRTTNDRLDKDVNPFYYVPLNPYRMSQHKSTSSHMDTLLDAGGIDKRLFALNATLEQYRAQAKGETIDI